MVLRCIYTIVLYLYYPITLYHFYPIVSMEDGTFLVTDFVNRGLCGAGLKSSLTDSGAFRSRRMIVIVDNQKGRLNRRPDVGS